MIDLTGWTVLVTGASGGIGRETAAVLSSLHARIVLTGRNRERLEETFSLLSGEGHHLEVFDLTQLENVSKWLLAITERVGPLKGLVHAAGKQMTSPIKLVKQTEAGELLATNLQRAIMLMRGFSQKKCHLPQSSVVLISSITGLVGRGGASVYSASKAALIGLARSLAVELAPERIRVNCTSPASDV